MNETPSGSRRVLGIALIAGGALVLAALAAFLWIAIGFRQSFTASLPPLEDMAAGFALLSPLVLAAVAMIVYGRRLTRP
jgi:hypothetical protein